MNEQKKNLPAEIAKSILTQYPIIKEKISLNTGMDNLESERLFVEVVKYLTIVKEMDAILSPSYLVDQAWHQFILHTPAYREFCDNYLGKFVNHIPGRNYATKEEYIDTKLAIQNKYGTIDEKFWPNYGSQGPGKECDGNPNCVGS